MGNSTTGNKTTGNKTMGYTTTYTGAITVDPPLNEHELAYLRRFAASRRMDRDLGPYFCGEWDADEDSEPGIRHYSWPGPEQPGLWCHWEPTADGRGIEWNGVEKFYYGERWMAFLIQTFLAPGATLAEELAAPIEGRYYAPEFEHFTFDHVLTGRIEARGDEPDDVWQLVVTAGDGVFMHPEGEEPQRVTDTGPDPLAYPTPQPS